MDSDPPSNLGASTSSLSFLAPPALYATAHPPPPPPSPPHGRQPTPRSTSYSSSFFRDAKVSPDGSCALVASDDRSLSLYLIPSATDSETLPLQLEPTWTFNPSDALLSYEWFPGASPSNPAFFAFAVAVKDHPVELRDGFDHRLRASYPIVDHRERFVAPHAMAFSSDGSQLYAGFDSAIEILDISRPGHEGVRLHTSPTRSSRAGQKGIISALAFSPNHSGLLAAGSFSGTVGLYDTTSNNVLIKLLKSDNRGGITKLTFHPSSHLLFAASRISDSIDVWDMRNLSRLKGQLARATRTNQRLGFDIDASGTWLAAGDQTGRLIIFSAEFDPDNLEPVTSFDVGDGAPVGSTSFVPNSRMLLTCSGTRRFELDSDDGEEEGEEEGEKEDGIGGREALAPRSAEKAVPLPDAPSLKLWALS